MHFVVHLLTLLSINVIWFGSVLHTLNINIDNVEPDELDLKIQFQIQTLATVLLQTVFQDFEINEDRFFYANAIDACFVLGLETQFP